MISQIKDKKVIFFDVGYTLDRPASGDWLFTNMFLELAGKRLKLHSDEEIRDAREYMLFCSRIILEPVASKPARSSQYGVYPSARAAEAMAILIR